MIEPGSFTDAAAFTNPYLGFARDGASIGYAAALGRGSFGAWVFQGTQLGNMRDADAGEAKGVLAE